MVENVENNCCPIAQWYCNGFWFRRFLGSNPSRAFDFKYMMPCSTTVVQSAVNTEVVGSNPTGAVNFGPIV